jgi:NAD(P)-dependent dehydrogenase (short-subunit alcohol dehydrogenase family)
MTSRGPLAGRVALVTGGGRGIGRAISLRLAADGAAVAVNYRRDEDAAAATVKEIDAAGGRAAAYHASVDSADECAAMVEQVLADFGFVDILVNNAGIASRGKTVVDTDPAEMERVVRTHALGAFFLCRLLVPQMRDRPRGDVVMVSSVGARRPMPGGAPYMMAKSAQEALAATLAVEEMAHGIHVNVVAPGLVATDMGDRLAHAVTGVGAAADLDAVAPYGRVCRPEDVADVVAYLVSEQAAYLNGQRIEVDGGGSPFSNRL